MPTLPPDLAAFARLLDAHSRLSASAGSPSRCGAGGVSVFSREQPKE